MTSAAILPALVLVTGFIMALAPVSQLWRMLRTRSSDGVALLWPANVALGVLCLTAYGLSLGDPVIWVASAVSFLANSATLLVALHYRRSARARGPQTAA